MTFAQAIFCQPKQGCSNFEGRQHLAVYWLDCNGSHDMMSQTYAEAGFDLNFESRMIQRHQFESWFLF